MRHKLGLKKLNRTSSHRQALFRNLCCALLEHEAIITTLPKAKALRKVVEPLITVAKLDRKPSEGSEAEKKAFIEYRQAQHRLVFSRLRNRPIVLKLFNDVGPRNANRPGGYIRILKAGFRRGDNAPLAYVELVEKRINAEAVNAE